MLAIKFILLVISVFIGYLGGYLFTEKWNIGKYKIFDFEAFQCRQCLSFHIAWVTSTIISLLFGDWVMLFIGIGFAFMLFIGLKIDQNRKTIDLNNYHITEEEK